MGPILHSIGEPTDEEQLYLEYINRARANPAQEGQRLFATGDPDIVTAYQFFGVDLALMTNAFAAIPPAPPLAMNARLLAAARLHSGDMFTNAFQEHVSSDGRTLTDRVQAQGYSYARLGENVFAYAQNPFHGHAGFEVDWGQTDTGMQDPPGHRDSIHNPEFREVGIGIVNGSNDPVGPQLVTQDFGLSQNATPLVTGVVYFDFDGDNFYDLGEGIGGVRIDAGGSDYHAVTASSGGYALPVPGDGSYTVTFSVAGLAVPDQTVTVVDLANLKVDLALAYEPPVVQGPAQAVLGQANRYTCTPVAAATAYQWHVIRLIPTTFTDGAENGLTADLLATVTAGYPVVSETVQAGGQASFHLAHPTPSPTDPPADQRLELNRQWRAGGLSELSFTSRLGWATANQMAQVRVSTDSGVSWQTIWEQPGAGLELPGELSFSNHTISLAAFAGQPLRLRFVYAYSSGQYYPQTSDGVGWYIDDISVRSVDEPAEVANFESTTPAYDFTPVEAGTHEIRARSRVGDRWLSYGPGLVVGTTAAPVSVEIGSIVWASATSLQFEVQVQNGAASALALEGRDSLAAAWTGEPAAGFEVLSPGARYRCTVSLSTAPQRFFRVRLQP